MVLNNGKYPEKNFFIFSWVFFFVLVISGGSVAKEGSENKVAVIVSQNIKPYYEAVEGLMDGLKRSWNGAEIVVIEFEPYSKKTFPLTERIVSGGYGSVVAVGPEASVYLSTLNKKKFMSFYIMLLDPETTIVSDYSSACGVSLNIPIFDQLSKISKVFPRLKKVGVIYDPQNNADFLRKAKTAAKQINLSIIEFPVSSASDIPAVLDANLSTIDLIWFIPDKTVISESLTPYIIRKAMDRTVPCVGYNRFFHSNGAAMSFIFDYKKIGEQSARMILDQSLKKSGSCTFEAPLYDVSINNSIMNLLGLESGKVSLEGEGVGE